MGSVKNRNELLNYLGKKLDADEVKEIYKKNRIEFEKCELYQDFILSLFMLIFDTYMGDSVTRKNQRVEHFSWCWNKVIKNFKLEGICFEDTDELYNYFLNFMLDVYYFSKKEEGDIEDNIKEMWLYILDYQSEKTRSDLDALIEVYQMLDKSLELCEKNG